MFNKRVDLFPNNSNVERWSRTYLVIVILNLTIAASFYLIPSILGYGWNNSAGESILNVHKEDRRYPASNITSEPWGASVLLGPAESRLRDYFVHRILPLWNPYQGLGEPYAAQGDGSPYSLPALARALLPPWAGNLVTFGVFAIGAIGMYAFLALLGLSKEIRLFGAIAAFLSTALTFHIARYNIGDQNALIPVQFAITTWAIQRRVPFTYFVLACSTAVTITAGFIQSALFAVAIALLFGVALIWVRFESWRERGSVFSAVITATLVGIALTAPFWLPIVEISVVGYHKNVPSIVVYRPPPYNLAAFFFPSLLGETLTFPVLSGGEVLVDWHNLFATSSAFVLLLCLIGLFACNWDQRGHRFLFWFAISCATIFALRFMHWPPFSLLSRDIALAQQTTKHTQAIAAFLTLLASMLVLEQCKNWLHARLRWVYIGFCSIPIIVFSSAVINSAEPLRTLASLQPLAIALIVASAACAFVFRMSQQRFGSTTPSFLTIVGVIICSELSLYLPLGTGDWRIACARLVLCIAWVSACYLILIRRSFIAAALAGVIILCYSAIIALPKQGLPQQESNRALPPFAEFLRTHVPPDYRTFGIFPNFSSLVKVQDIGVVGPFATSGFAAFIHSIDPKGELRFYGSSVFLLGQPVGQPRQLDVSRYIHYRHIFDWLGVRYLVLEKSVPSSPSFLGLQNDGSKSFRTVFSDGAVSILESLRSKRRFEFSSSPIISRSQSEIIRKLQSDPSIVDRSILLESAATDDFLEKLAVNADASEGSAEIELLEENPNYLRLKVNNSRNGIVVVKDSHFPGWEALVDDRKAPIFRVNGMVRGVEIVSPGTHIIELRYRPSSFWYGVFAGLAAFILFVVLLFWHADNPRVIEIRLAIVGILCVCFIATSPAMVISSGKANLRLGRYEGVSAIDLRNRGCPEFCV